MERTPPASAKTSSPTPEPPRKRNSLVHPSKAFKLTPEAKARVLAAYPTLQKAAYSPTPENVEEPHEFASTQVNLPPSIGSDLQKLAASIPVIRLRFGRLLLTLVLALYLLLA